MDESVSVRRRKAVQLFLDALTDLSRTHSLYIDLKGVCCCGILEARPLEEDTHGVQCLEWDPDENGYTGMIYG